MTTVKLCATRTLDMLFPAMTLAIPRASRPFRWLQVRSVLLCCKFNDCNFILVTKHVHPLRHMTQSPYEGGFICDLCGTTSNGPVYHCDTCGFYDNCQKCFRQHQGNCTHWPNSDVSNNWFRKQARSCRASYCLLRNHDCLRRMEQIDCRGICKQENHEWSYRFVLRWLLILLTYFKVTIPAQFATSVMTESYSIAKEAA